MRWIHYNKNNPSESSEHDRMLQRIDAWWAEFKSNTDRLEAVFRQADNWDLPAWMDEHLQKIDSRLMWEFGPAINGQSHRLVITPESHSELRPLANEVVARAPRIDGWEFYTYRVPEILSTSLIMVSGRTDIDVTDVTVAVALGKDNRIDLTYRWEQIPPDDEQAFDAAFVATESLLGEKMLDRWVGVIQLVDDTTPPERNQRFLPLDRLKPTFDALVDSTCSQLPAEPYSELVDDAQWAMMTLQPEESIDYPERYDLLNCLTCNSDLVSATFSNAPFFSERYSRCGETFCYVKIDGSDTSEMGFQDREDMEEAARNALEAQDVGCLIGSGTGLRYSYIELALTDVSRGINAIRRAMQDGNVPRRSWILFHDADYDAEWVGIYDDSPAVPMAPATD